MLMSQPHTPKDSKIYSSKISVRGYELDSFGHTNHAHYLSFMEHARWELLAQEGITLKHIGEWKRWPVIAGVEVKYLKPTYMGDVLEIRTQALEHGRTHFKLSQKILRGETVVLDATVFVVIVNETGRPDQIPSEMTRLWETQR